MLRWPDSASQRNLLKVAARFSAEIDAENRRTVVITEIAPIAVGVHFTQHGPVVDSVFDPTEMLFGTIELPALGADPSVLEPMKPSRY